MSAEYHDFVMAGRFSLGLDQGMQTNPNDVIALWDTVRSGWARLELESIAEFRMDPATLTINILSVENGYLLLVAIFPDIRTNALFLGSFTPKPGSSRPGTTKQKPRTMGLAEFVLPFKNVARELARKGKVVILQHEGSDLCRLGDVNGGPILKLLGIPHFELCSKLSLLRFVSSVFAQH